LVPTNRGMISRRFSPWRGSKVSKRADSACESLFEPGADLFDVVSKRARKLEKSKGVEEVRLLRRQRSPSAH
jgi:hypothetical protein